MRSIFLTRRWLLFALVVVVLAAGTWWLGSWQFDRLADKKASNAVIRTNEHREPAPVDQVLDTDRESRESDEWRVVTATGTYAVDDTVVVRYRSRDDASGIDVIVPLVTADGTALLVDRGWMAASNNIDADDLDIPAPPAGEVTVTGYVRADSSHDAGTSVDPLGDLHSTRAVSAERIGEATGLTVYDGFVELASESPEAAEPLAPEPLPELDNGPHFFYGLQWWFFGLLAIGGFFYLAYDEWRGQRRRRDGVPAGSGSGAGGGDGAGGGGGDGAGGGADGAPEPAAQPALSPRAAAKRAKAERKKAVKEAYRAAYERERSGR